ncbi:hypothetical protein HAX54_021913 [Datura stramonium]|uniref:Secreted protein n=1 Tax=Datura stramonium TaxID=4076 RepID=A0ABS8UUY6_DATST|nr:hypothetical protein [Datura stramonium]
MEFVRHLLMAAIAVMKRVVLAGFGVWSRDGSAAAFWSCYFSPVPAAGSSEERGREWGESGVMREAAGSGCSRPRWLSEKTTTRRRRELRLLSGDWCEGEGMRNVCAAFRQEVELFG